MEHEGELIWLRQSATFSVNGQTRTVEIAVPVRPDASAEEVEALMSQANMGMDALTRELDARVASLVAGEAQHAAVPEAAQTRGAPAAAPSTAPVAQTAAAATPPAEPAPSARPASTSSAADASPAEAPTQASRPAQAAPARPQPAQMTPQQPAPARAGASGPLRTQPPQPPAKPTPAPAAPQKAAATTPAGPDISRAEFIAAAAEMGLNPGQAMERLGVRSLQGLNLREALEALRRQMVRDGGDAQAMPAPTSSPAQGSRSAQATRATTSASITAAPEAGRREAAQPQPPRYFEEEDDLETADFTFTLDGDGTGDFYDDEFGGIVGEEAAGYSADGLNGAYNTFGPLDDLEDIDLDEVPDFGPPPTPARMAPVMPVMPPAPAAPAASRRGTARANAAAPSQEAAEPAEETPVMEGRSLGMQRIGHFRSIRGGGAPTSQQRMAYRNIVVRELGDGDARALVQGIWRVTPDRLGSEQLDALVSWGKRDTFAEEAALVLAMLQEERERNENAAPTEAMPPQASQAAPRASGTGTATQRSTGRSRSAGRPAAQAGDA